MLDELCYIICYLRQSYILWSFLQTKTQQTQLFINHWQFLLCILMYLSSITFKAILNPYGKPKWQPSSYIYKIIYVYSAKDGAIL